MKSLRVIFSTLTLQMKQSLIRPMFQFCLVVNPIVNTILLYEMFRNSGQPNFTNYVILGAGLMGLWSCICFSSAGDINRERYSGTLSLIFATPAKFSTIIFGKILGNTIISLLTLLISFLTARLIYQAPFSVPHPGLFSISLFLIIISFIVVSMWIAYLLTLSRKTTLYMNIIEIPLILLCGFVFPIEILPNWVQPISKILPPTWAVKLLRMSMDQVVNYSIYFKDAIILLSVTFIYFLLSILLHKVIQKQVRIHATLEVC